MARHLAFTPCSALKFIRRDGNTEFANDDDAVKFTAFYVKNRLRGQRKCINLTGCLERKFERFPH